MLTEKVVPGNKICLLFFSHKIIVKHIDVLSLILGIAESILFDKLKKAVFVSVESCGELSRVPIFSKFYLIYLLL